MRYAQSRPRTQDGAGEEAQLKATTYVALEFRGFPVLGKAISGEVQLFLFVMGEDEENQEWTYCRQPSEPVR